LDNPQALVESPRAEGDECPRAEGAESPRAEGAEPAEARDSGPQEKDRGLEMGDTGQMTEYYLKEEEVRRRTGKEEEEEEKKIPTSKAKNLWKWWRNRWTAPMDMQSNDVKHKAPDESQPAKEEVVESDDVTLEDGAVQTGEVKKPLK
jgi:hypothetical protein